MTTPRSMTVLDVAHVGASVAFCARPGFASHGIWADSFAIVQRGTVTFALSRAQQVALNEGWAPYVYVDDVDALQAEFSALDPPYLLDVSKPEHDGCGDFTIQDIDGHPTAFGQSRHPVPGPGLDEDLRRG